MTSTTAANAGSPGGERAAVYWLIRAVADVPTHDAWLAAAEAAHLAGLRVAKRRRDWRLGRWTAKTALAAYLAPAHGLLPFTRLEVLPAADGAPQGFLDGEPLAVAFSFSHSGGRALCAVAGADPPTAIALGCDLEAVEERSATFVRDYFTAAEQALIAGRPAAERPLMANLLWSAKESALKALRTGLRLDTRTVEARLPGPPAGAPDRRAGGWRPLEVRRLPAGETFGGWWRRAGGQVMTVVASPAAALPIELAAGLGPHHRVG